MRVIENVDALFDLEGQELGVSEWVTVDQERINLFADATGDHQWIHIDVERAEKESPYGTTIAHGYLTLSLLPMLSKQVFQVKNVKASINYGLNRLRFTGPVRAGDQVQLRLTLKSVTRRDDGQVQVISSAEITVKGSDRPACVAETVALHLP
ncbi:MAG: MaoC family dehydratase [Ectothiorhodospiraceae bacterium]|nr:MaoC family dehydratase [Ectothiorhodospiraceae bacterium]MCH8504435.1 MaoC family dehydratase [Ectothiorhodospiraceae bacterium]